MLDIVHDLSNQGLDLKNPDLSQEDVLKVITFLITVVFDCSADIIQAIPEDILSKWPAEETLHVTAIPRYRILCALGRLRALLDVHSLTEADLISQSKRAVLGATKAPNKQGRSALHLRLQALCRAAQEFLNWKSYFENECQSEVAAVIRAEDDLYAQEEKVGDVTAQLSEANIDMERIKAEITLKHQKVKEAKSMLEGYGRDLRSLMENISRLQQQSVQKQCEYDNLEKKILYAKSEVDKRQKEVVDDPEKLRKDKESTQEQLMQAEKESLEAMRQEKAMRALEKAYYKAKSCCDKQREMLDIYKLYVSKTQECQIRIEELSRKDQEAQKLWKEKLQHTRYQADECVKELATLKSQKLELDKRQALEEERAKVEQETVLKIQDEIDKVRMEREKENAQIAEIDGYLMNLNRKEEATNQKIDHLKSTCEKWECELGSFPNDLFAQFRNEQDFIKRATNLSNFV